MEYCADTWYLLKLSEQDNKAFEIWKKVIDGKDRLFVPTIVIMELFRKLMHLGRKNIDIENFLNNLTVSEKIKTVFLDERIAKEAAKISFSYGISAIDAIIAATCKLTACDRLLSDDEDLKKLHRRYIKVESW